MSHWQGVTTPLYTKCTESQQGSKILYNKEWFRTCGPIFKAIGTLILVAQTSGRGSLTDFIYPTLCKGLCGSCKRLFSSPSRFSYKGVYGMTSAMPGEERSGEGPTHMTNDARKGKVNLGSKVPPQCCPLLGTWGFEPWWPSVPGLSFLLCSCLSNCPLHHTHVTWTVSLFIFTVG